MKKRRIWRVIDGKIETDGEWNMEDKQEWESEWKIEGLRLVDDKGENEGEWKK